MKKRLLSILLVLCLTLALLPGTVLAVANRSYPVTGGNIYLVAAGMSPWAVSSCDKSVTNAILPSEIPENGAPPESTLVTSIQFEAFSGCSRLVSVTIPNTITSIGDRAFMDCTRLTSVTIGNGVSIIGDGAFTRCSSLTDVYYDGSASQWKRISIGKGNDNLLNARIHYNVSVVANGREIQWTDAAPYIDANDRTMVPLRAVGDALGLTVDWDGNAREASFTNGTKTIYFPIGKTTARTSDGQSIQMDTAAVIRNDRTYAPVRYLAEYFGFTVGWDGSTRTVSITEKAVSYFSDDDLIRMAKAYYFKYHGFTPPIVDVENTGEEDMVMIHLYSIVNNHTATSDWYTVSRVTGKGTNILFNDVDLTEVL